MTGAFGLEGATLGRLAVEPKSLGERRRDAATLWHRHGVLLVLAEDRAELNGAHRSILDHVAARLYGARVG